MKKKKGTMRADKAEYDKFNTVSATECTGLITVPPEDEYELENYMDLCDFGPPIVPKKHKK